MKTALPPLLLLGMTLGLGLRAEAQAPPAATASPAPAPLTLRYKFTPGQVLRYKMTMDMTYTIPAIGARGPQTIQGHAESVSSQTVKSVRPADGAATLVTRIQSMTTTTNGRTHTFTPEELAQVNKGNSTVMTPAGRVETAKVGALSSGVLPGLDMSKGLMTSTGALPNGPVKVGDTWDGSGASGMMGMRMKMASTLSGASAAGAGVLADIGQTYQGNFNLSMGSAQTPMHMTGQMSGTGQVHFDTGAGAVADSSSAMNMDMTMAIPTSAGAPAGTPKALPMKVAMTIKTERLPTPAAPSP